MPNYRTLIHEDNFDKACVAIEQDKSLEPPLRGLMWGISEKADEFDIVEDNIRLAKTHPVITADGKEIPRLFIWFEIIDDNTVNLKHIETVLGDDSE